MTDATATLDRDIATAANALRAMQRNAGATIREHVTIWRLLYLSIAIATFRHSAIGFATLEGGNVLLGALSALAVDIGMIMAAEQLQKRIGGWLVAGLVVAAIASVYSQLLYAVTHADAIAIAQGALWMQAAAQRIIDWRVIIFPLLLPGLAVIYAFAAKPAQAGQESATDETQAPKSAIGTTKQARAAQLHLEQPDLTKAQIAEMVPCDPSTVTRAFKELAANGNGRGA